jgi:hypothetical protein
MKTVIEAHVPTDYTSFTLDLPALDVVHPILCLSMGDDKSEASFYDFVHWYVDCENGVWDYDATTNVYKISAAKGSEGTPALLSRLDASFVTTVFPETERCNLAVMNSYMSAAKTEEVVQEFSVTGVREETLLTNPLYMPLGATLTNRKTLETARHALREHEVTVEFCRYPKITFRPGKFVSLGPEWEVVYPAGKEYRVHQVRIKAKAVNQEPQYERGVEAIGYEIDMTGLMELKAEPRVPKPRFTKPHYPIYVEAKMLCETGAETDKTYQYTEDADTSLHYYRVSVPLWTKEIIVPYKPNRLPGHMYFPIYKNSRLLLSLFFRYAEIERTLDWGPDVRLPLEGQGNHILFGKNATSQTSLRHVYEEDKPVLYLDRTSAADKQFMQVREGCIILQTMEEQQQGGSGGSGGSGA